jgi:GT2 family glycosyltransferase
VAGPQRGPAANRNHGASLAGGDFILFLDDDVEPGPELLAGYRAALRDDVDVYEGRTTCRAGLKSPLQDSPANEKGGFLWSCNLMIRASFWRSFGGFDELFPYPHLEDVAFHHRITTANVRTVFVPAATVDHPPRPVPPAEVIARHQESYFVYCYKYLRQVPSRRTLMSLLVRHRVAAIRQYQPSRDTLTAVRSLFVEAALILKNWSAWDKKWRGLMTTDARP